MDINKPDNNINKRFPKTESTKNGEKSSSASSSNSAKSPRDKVSLSEYKFRNNDQLFAKLELEKLNMSSSQKLGDMKAKITEYKKALAESPEKAKETEIGKKLSSPDVWGDIANKILK
jgi:hypothetical protein